MIVLDLFVGAALVAALAIFWAPARGAPTIQNCLYVKRCKKQYSRK